MNGISVIYNVTSLDHYDDKLKLQNNWTLKLIKWKKPAGSLRQAQTSTYENTTKSSV